MPDLPDQRVRLVNFPKSFKDFPAGRRVDFPPWQPLNQANVYANTIGRIWLVKEGQSSNREHGTGYVWDIPSVQSGFYANR